MRPRHEGRTVAITGGAKGIGRGIAERFAAEGATVVVGDVDMDAASELAATDDSITAIETDVTDEGSVDAFVDAVVDAHGRLDVMVNNAGVIFVSPAIETDVKQWRHLVDVNLTGVFLGSRAAARQMIAQGHGGVIVNASSGGGRHGVPNFAHYCASKAGIIMLSQSLAIELAEHRIRVNCYAPGHIRTPLWGDIVSGFGERTGQTEDEVIEAFRQTIPWGRFGTSEDVAAAVSWLCTDDAEYISGQAIAMNGAELPW